MFYNRKTFALLLIEEDFGIMCIKITKMIYIKINSNLVIKL